MTKYAQEYALVTIIPGEIMATNIIISIKTKIYTKAEVSDLDNMCVWVTCSSFLSSGRDDGIPAHVIGGRYHHTLQVKYRDIVVPHLQSVQFMVRFRVYDLRAEAPPLQ